MNSLLLFGFASFALSWFLTALVENQALHLGLLVHLDNHSQIARSSPGWSSIVAEAIGVYVMLSKLGA